MGSKKIQEQGKRGAEEEEDAGTRGRADAGSCGTHRSPHRDLSQGWRGPRTPCPCLRVIPSPRQSRRDSPHLGTWAPLHRHLSTWAPGHLCTDTSAPGHLAPLHRTPPHSSPLTFRSPRHPFSASAASGAKGLMPRQAA